MLAGRSSIPLLIFIRNASSSEGYTLPALFYLRKLAFK